MHGKWVHGKQRQASLIIAFSILKQPLSQIGYTSPTMQIEYHALCGWRLFARCKQGDKATGKKRWMGGGRDINFLHPRYFLTSFVINTSYILCSISNFCNKPMNGAMGFQIVSKKKPQVRCLGKGYIRLFVREKRTLILCKRRTKRRAYVRDKCG